VAVDSDGYFYDGFGIPGEQGDWLHVGTGKTLARVVKADVERDRLELDRPVTCGKGEPVTLAYAGKAPDIGAYEFGSEQERYYAARLPEALRVPTMEEADEPVIVVSFEEADRERWHHLVNGGGGVIRLDPKTAHTGKQSLRLVASGETYYFQVPEGVKRFRVATSNPDGLKLADASGVWSVSAEEVTDVAFSDIAPAFAYMNKDLLFLPQGLQMLQAEPETELSKSGPLRPRGRATGGDHKAQQPRSHGRSSVELRFLVSSIAASRSWREAAPSHPSPEVSR
jgi:hypothetical protein